MLIVQRRIEPRGRHDEQLVLAWQDRQKSRLRTRLASGREVGLFLARGTVLSDGDFLEADDGTVIRVIAALEPLMEARCDDAQVFARCAYHLGNRHSPVEIAADPGGGRLRFVADEVLSAMLTGLGARVHAVSAPFSPEPGAYAAGSHAHSGEQRHSGIIHDHFGRGGR